MLLKYVIIGNTIYVTKDYVIISMFLSKYIVLTIWVQHYNGALLQLYNKYWVSQGYSRDILFTVYDFPLNHTKRVSLLLVTLRVLSVSSLVSISQCTRLICRLQPSGFPICWCLVFFCHVAVIMSMQLKTIANYFSSWDHYTPLLRMYLCKNEKRLSKQLAPNLLPGYLYQLRLVM